MRAKATTANGMLSTYKCIGVACVVGTSLASMLIPTQLSNHFNIPITTTRIITFLLTSITSYGILNHIQHIWLEAYNSLLSKEAYDIQQALKECGRIDIEDIDEAIKTLQIIKDATDPNQNK